MLKIKQKVINEIIGHAQSEEPIEACGYLAGNDNNITESFPMTNVDHSPEHYSFSPEEQFKVVKEIRSKNLLALAVYHSHPNSEAYFSDEDLRLAYDNSIYYVVVSLVKNEPEVRSYRIVNGAAVEEFLEVL